MEEDRFSASLTYTDEDGDVPPGAQVGHKDDCDDVPDLVHGGDDARNGAGDLVPLLDGRDGRVEVPGRQSLLHCHQDRQ